jgi:hypothetical protein
MNSNNAYAMNNTNAMPALTAAPQPAVNHPVQTSKDPYQRMMDFFSASFNNMDKGKKKARSKTIKFPMKLMYVLECGEYDEVLRWSKNGKSFVVVDAKHFEKMVLPALFKTSKFDSFVRKLSRWGFAKRSGTGSRNGSTPIPIWFCHPSFQKGKFSLCSTAVLCNSKVDVEASLALLNKADCEDDDKFNDKTAMQFLNANSGRNMNVMNGLPSLSGSQGASGVVPSSSVGLMSAGGFALNPQMLGNSGMRIIQQQFQGPPIMQNNGMLMTQLPGQNNMSNMGFDNNNMNSMASLNNNVAYLLMQNPQGLLSGGFQNNQMNNFNDHQYGNRNQSPSTQDMSQHQGMQQPSNGNAGNRNNMNFSSLSSNQAPLQQDNRMSAPSSGNLNTGSSLDVMENVQQQLLQLERQRLELMTHVKGWHDQNEKIHE